MSDRHQRQGSHTSYHGLHKCSSICLHNGQRSTTSSTALTTNHSGWEPSNTARMAPVIRSVSVRTRPHALHPAYLRLAHLPLLEHPHNTTLRRQLLGWQLSDSTHCCACQHCPTLQYYNTSNCAQPCSRGTTRHPARHHRIPGDAANCDAQTTPSFNMAYSPSHAHAASCVHLAASVPAKTSQPCNHSQV